MRGDVIARTASANDQALRHQLRDGRARSHTGHIQGFGQYALGWQRFFGLVAPIANRTRQHSGELLVDRRAVLCIGFKLQEFVGTHSTVSKYFNVCCDWQGGQICLFWFPASAKLKGWQLFASIATQISQALQAPQHAVVANTDRVI